MSLKTIMDNCTSKQVVDPYYRPPVTKICNSELSEQGFIYYQLQSYIPNYNYISKHLSPAIFPQSLYALFTNFTNTEIPA